MKNRVVVGIDEAGRGPLAGPVAVGVAVVADDFDWSCIPGVTDSKQLSPQKRATLFKQAKELRGNGTLDFTVVMVSAKVIDRIGIVPAVQMAMKRALKRLQLDPDQCTLKLDGGLTAPDSYEQETIIKGDQKERVIGLASICAKETRDAYMVRKAKLPEFVQYDFSSHKGYGTKSHRVAIKERGISKEHRSSYCKNCQ
jgi:ribonuclease HII